MGNQEVSRRGQVDGISKGVLASVRGSLVATITEERFIRALKTTLHQSPKLMECSGESITMACTQAAGDGLLIDGREAAIVPYKGKAKYIPMVSGILKLAYNHPNVLAISSQVVYQSEVDNGDFHHELAPVETVKHTRSLNFKREQGDELAGAYAVATLQGGVTMYAVMRRDQVMAVKSISAGSKNSDGPWAKFEERMWEKSAVHRLCRRLPRASEYLGSVLANDEQNYTFDGESDEVEDIKDVPPEPAPSATERMKAQIEGDFVEEKDAF